MDDIGNFVGEKTAFPNVNSIRGFEVVDQIKQKVNKACKGNVVSCADILAVAARDSVAIVSIKLLNRSKIQKILLTIQNVELCFEQLGGPNYKVLLGRRDARTASVNDANRSLPPPFFSFSQLLSSFQSQGLDLKDLVLLSAGHTLGKARCATFRTRIYNDTNIDRKFAASLKAICPPSGKDNNLMGLDKTSNFFDNAYFKALLNKKGLLHSDQELFGGGSQESDELVSYYSRYPYSFRDDFGSSMIKMGNIKPLTGSYGEIRQNCRFVN